ncbi:hypothetical protein TNCT_61731 [Trichonephila clavata]|uniref:Uncharacterized protein n=1 Tax=Trichonephila clavata TaxID=2740835 RepID=A0A8X6G984_TRICU|nr:hypothetical protein TNCT_61731 [Trichonephila clavata]
MKRKNDTKGHTLKKKNEKPMSLIYDNRQLLKRISFGPWSRASPHGNGSTCWVAAYVLLWAVRQNRNCFLGMLMATVSGGFAHDPPLSRGLSTLPLPLSPLSPRDQGLE